MLCGDMEYQERVFQIQAEVRSHQTLNRSPVTHVRPDILSIIETLIQLFIQTTTPTKDESRLLHGDLLIIWKTLTNGKLRGPQVPVFKDGRQLQ